MRHTFATLLTLGLLFFSAAAGYSQSAEDAELREEAELKGESAQKNGDLDLAIANFSEAIRLDPKFTSAYNNRGLAYYNKGKYDTAIADFSEVIRLDPKLTLAYSRRADAYSNKGNYDKSLADYSEVIRLDPKFTRAYVGRSDAYGHKGDHDKAIADSIEAIRLDPKSAGAHNSLGVAYEGYAKGMLRADAKAAESLFDRASENFDGPPRKLDAAQQQLPPAGSIENFRAATRKLDRAHKVQLLFDYSAAAFKAAIDIQPDYDFGNNNLGVYYARRGGPEDTKLAENYFREALRSNQRYADAYNNLGIVLARQGKLDESIASHKAGLNVRNDRASDHNNLCRVYMQKYDLDFKKGDIDNAKGDLDNASKEISISLKCDPNFLDAWMNRAEISLKQDNPGQAARCARRMVAIDANAPETIRTQLMFARHCLDRNRLDEGIDFLNQSLKNNDAVPDIYHARGLFYWKKGDWKRAEEDLAQTERLSPRFPGIREKLKEVRRQLVQPPK